MLRCTDEGRELNGNRHKESTLKGGQEPIARTGGRATARSICLRVNSPTKSEVDAVTPWLERDRSDGSRR